MAKNTKILKFNTAGSEYDFRPTATCSTNMNDAAKTVSISDFTLFDKATVLVKFSNRNFANNITLNVNNTGDIPVIANDYIFDKEVYYEFVYNESNNAWHLVNRDRNSIGKIITQNTNNFPWHRIAYTIPITQNEQSSSIVLIINNNLLGASNKYGELVVKVKTQGTDTASLLSTDWRIKQGIEDEDIKIGFYDINGETYCDIFYKTSETYANLLIENKSNTSSSDNTFYICNSSEVTNTTENDKLTSFECYKSVEDAAIELHGKEYTYIVSPNYITPGTANKELEFNGTANNAIIAETANALESTYKAKFQTVSNNNKYTLYDTTPLLRNEISLGTKCQVVTAPNVPDTINDILSENPDYKYSDFVAPFGKVWYCTGETSYKNLHDDEILYVTPGDVLCAESWIMRPIGAEGVDGYYYLGLEFKDKNGKFISSSGATYISGHTAFICPTDGRWHKRYGEITVPNKHTIYTNKDGNTSDGEGCYTCSVCLLLNFANGSNEGTIPTYFGGVRIYKKNIATETEAGDIKIGFKQTGKKYPVELDSSNKAFVNVPWVENNNKVQQTVVDTSNTPRPLLLGPSNQTESILDKAYFDSGVTLNPQTNILDGAKVYESLIQWGNTNIINGLSPIDVATDLEWSSNRLSFLPADQIEIEYSTDGGTNWNPYYDPNEIYDADGEKINDKKCKFVTTGFSQPLYLGNKNKDRQIPGQDKLRVTITASANKTYFSLKKIYIMLNSYGCTESKVLIEQALSNTDTIFTELKTYNIAGAPGWNSIPLNKYFGGSADLNNRTRKLRFTFYFNNYSEGFGAEDSLKQVKFYVTKLRMIGETVWNNSGGNLPLTGHLYSYDINKNATFPANLVSTGALLSESSLTVNGNTILGNSESNTVTINGSAVISNNLQVSGELRGNLIGNAESAYRANALYDTEHKKTSVNDCYDTNWDHSLKYFTLGANKITEGDITKYYAGTNNTYGFPVGNNANGLLWLGNYKDQGIYGHQLGFSSNGNIYHRIINNGNFPTTQAAELGGSWNILMKTDINNLYSNNIVPKNSNYSLGDSEHQWNTIYANNGNFNKLSIEEDITVNNIIANGIEVSGLNVEQDLQINSGDLCINYGNIILEDGHLEGNVKGNLEGNVKGDAYLEPDFSGTIYSINDIINKGVYAWNNVNLNNTIEDLPIDKNKPYDARLTVLGTDSTVYVGQILSVLNIDNSNPYIDIYTRARTNSLTPDGEQKWNDWKKLGEYNGNTESSEYELPIAGSDILGGIKTGYSESDKNYAVQVDKDGNAFVTVPWTDTDTDTKYELPIANTTTLGGIKFVITDNTTTIPTTASGEPIPLIGNAEGKAFIKLPNASSNNLGGIKTGYSESGINYAVKLDDDNNAYVTVSAASSKSYPAYIQDSSALTNETIYTSIDNGTYQDGKMGSPANKLHKIILNENTKNLNIAGFRRDELYVSNAVNFYHLSFKVPNDNFNLIAPDVIKWANGIAPIFNKDEIVDIVITYFAYGTNPTEITGTWTKYF